MKHSYTAIQRNFIRSTGKQRIDFAAITHSAATNLISTALRTHVHALPRGIAMERNKWVIGYANIKRFPKWLQ